MLRYLPENVVNGFVGDVSVVAGCVGDVKVVAGVEVLVGCAGGVG